MIAGIRPDERNDDRVRIKNEVYSFLDAMESNTSDYSKLRVDSAIELLKKIGAATTVELASSNPSAIKFLQGIGAILTSPNPFITGAITAVLPMTFAIADRNGNRLEFQMLINPTSMNHGKTSSVQSSYTRQGYVTQVWGTNQDLLTSNGTTAAFMVEGGGLTAIARRRSVAYGNFLSFLYAYRNNGYRFSDPTDLREQLTRVISVVHGVEMYYDNQTFMGHFNNFTLDENAERPFLFDYNFEFVVSSLSGNYNEVRGHFQPIPTGNQAVETNTVEEETSPRILGDIALLGDIA